MTDQGERVAALKQGLNINPTALAGFSGGPAGPPGGGGRGGAAPRGGRYGADGGARKGAKVVGGMRGSGGRKGAEVVGGMRGGGFEPAKLVGDVGSGGCRSSCLESTELVLYNRHRIRIRIGIRIRIRIRR